MSVAASKAQFKKTAKGKECQRRYNHSDNGRAARQRYEATDKYKDGMKRRYLARKHKIRELRMLRNYGITAERFAEILVSQGGKCAICEIPFSDGIATNIDHDHVTKIVRGVLCGSCNLGLGHFKDNPARLAGAINYLGAHR